MNKKVIINRVREICEPIMEECAYELVDIEFLKESSNYYLRIYIDKPGGISLDDCQKASQLLSEGLDSNDPIEVAYYLEVSSPGLDRPLKTDRDLERNLGKELELKLYEPLNGKKIIEALLESYDEKNLYLTTESNENLEIPRTTIALIKLAIKF